MPIAQPASSIVADHNNNLKNECQSADENVCPAAILVEDTIEAMVDP